MFQTTTMTYQRSTAASTHNRRGRAPERTTSKPIAAKQMHLSAAALNTLPTIGTINGFPSAPPWRKTKRVVIRSTTLLSTNATNSAHGTERRRDDLRGAETSTADPTNATTTTLEPADQVLQ